jgi:hypothetical protein
MMYRWAQEGEDVSECRSMLCSHLHSSRTFNTATCVDVDVCENIISIAHTLNLLKSYDIY